MESVCVGGGVSRCDAARLRLSAPYLPVNLLGRRAGVHALVQQAEETHACVTAWVNSWVGFGKVKSP